MAQITQGTVANLGLAGQWLWVSVGNRTLRAQATTNISSRRVTVMIDDRGKVTISDPNAARQVLPPRTERFHQGQRKKVEEPKSSYVVLLKIILPSTLHSSQRREMLCVSDGKKLLKIAEYEQWDWKEYHPEPDVNSLGVLIKDIYSTDLPWDEDVSDWGNVGVRGKKGTIGTGTASANYSFPAENSSRITLGASSTGTTSASASSIGLFSLFKGFYRTASAIITSTPYPTNTERYYGINPDVLTVFHGWLAYSTGTASYAIQGTVSDTEILMTEKQVEGTYLHIKEKQWFAWVKVREVDTRERYNRVRISVAIRDGIILEGDDPAVLLTHPSLEYRTLPDLPSGVIEESEWWYGISSTGAKKTYIRTKLFDGTYEYTFEDGVNPPVTQSSLIPITDFEQTPQSYLLTWDSPPAHPDVCAEDWASDPFINYKSATKFFYYDGLPDREEETIQAELESIRDTLFYENLNAKFSLDTATLGAATCTLVKGVPKGITAKKLDTQKILALTDNEVTVLPGTDINVIAFSAYIP